MTRIIIVTHRSAEYMMVDCNTARYGICHRFIIKHAHLNKNLSIYLSIGTFKCEVLHVDNVPEFKSASVTVNIAKTVC
jgi:hypothetical protein